MSPLVFDEVPHPPNFLSVPVLFTGSRNSIFHVFFFLFRYLISLHGLSSDVFRPVALF